MHSTSGTFALHHSIQGFREPSVQIAYTEMLLLVHILQVLPSPGPCVLSLLQPMSISLRLASFSLTSRSLEECMEARTFGSFVEELVKLLFIHIVDI